MRNEHFRVELLLFSCDGAHSVQRTIFLGSIQKSVTIRTESDKLKL